MDYPELVRETAAQMVHRHGDRAVPLLQDYAEIADGIDDALAAETWRDIEAAASQLLGASVIRQAAE